MDENNVHLPSGRIVSKHGDPLPNGDLVVLFHDTNAYEVVKPDTIGSSSSLMHIYLAALMGENEDMGESASLIGMNVRVLKRGREDVVGEVVDVDAHKKQVSVEISGEGIVQLDAADVYVDFTQNLPVDLLKYIFKCIHYPIATMGRLTRTNKQLKAKMNSDLIWEGALLQHYRQYFIQHMDFNGHVHPMVCCMLDSLTSDPSHRGQRYAKRFFEYMKKTGGRPGAVGVLSEARASLLARWETRNIRGSDMAINTENINTNFKFPSIVWQCGEHIYMLVAKTQDQANRLEGQVVLRYLSSEDIFHPNLQRKNVLESAITAKLVAHDQLGYVLAYAHRTDKTRAGYAYFPVGQVPSYFRNYALHTGTHYPDAITRTAQVALNPSGVFLEDRLWLRNPNGSLNTKVMPKVMPSTHHLIGAYNRNEFLFGRTLPANRNDVTVRLRVANGGVQEYPYPIALRPILRIDPRLLPIIHQWGAQPCIPFCYNQTEPVKPEGMQLKGHLLRVRLFGDADVDIVSGCIACGGNQPTIQEVVSGALFCDEECHRSWHEDEK